MNKRSKILLSVLGVVLVVFIGVLIWQGASSSEEATPEQSPLERSLSNRIEQLESVDFSLQVLDSEKFQNFSQYGDVPVQPSNQGRSNPFASF